MDKWPMGFAGSIRFRFGNSSNIPLPAGLKGTSTKTIRGEGEAVFRGLNIMVPELASTSTALWADFTTHTSDSIPVGPCTFTEDGSSHSAMSGRSNSVVTSVELIMLPNEGYQVIFLRPNLNATGETHLFSRRTGCGGSAIEHSDQFTSTLSVESADVTLDGKLNKGDPNTIEGKSVVSAKLLLDVPIKITYEWLFRRIEAAE